MIEWPNTLEAKMARLELKIFYVQGFACLAVVTAMAAIVVAVMK